MPATKQPKLSDAEWAETFARSFRELTDTIREWVKSQRGWQFSEGSNKTLHDEWDALQTGVPCEITVPPFRAPKSRDDWSAPVSHKGGILILEPPGRDWAGNSSVDFYAWPTLHRVYLLNDGHTAQWRILTESGIPWRREWNKENFVLLAHDLLAAGK